MIQVTVKLANLPSATLALQITEVYLEKQNPKSITFLKWNQRLKRLETKPRALPCVSIIEGKFCG